MGAFQLPDSVVGDAIACLIYSFVCLLANCVLIWLIWTHHERSSYVAFIAYFTLLATVSSVVQQFYDYIFWRDIMVEQFDYGREHAQDAEVQYQKSIFGLKLGLSYVRIFSITVEASLVFFFSLSLTATVYGWWAKKPRTTRTLSLIGRIVPIVLAIISIILLQLEFTHDSFYAYMAIANAQYIIALLGSCIFLLMILFKYLQSRHQLRTWQGVQYGQGGQYGPGGTRSTNTSQSFMKSRRSRAFSSGNSKANNATFDNWLVVRLTIAFLTLCVFEWTNISPRLSNRVKVLASLDELGPDLSEKRAMSTVTGYLSGVSPSMLAFLVFGTTKTFQRKMYNTFVPRFLRRNKDNDRDDIIRCRHASHQPPPYFPGSANMANNKSSRISHLPTTSTVYALGGTPRQSLSHMPSSSSLLPLRRPPSAVLAAGNLQHGGGGSRHDQDHYHHHLGPIHEPDHTWLAEESDATTSTRSTIRRSQIGVAIGTPTPPSLHEESDQGDDEERGRRKEADGRDGTTFFREDTPDSIAQIPMSRFNNHNGSSPQQNNTNDTLCRSGSVASTTTAIWSEGRHGSNVGSLSIPLRKSYARYYAGSTRRASAV